MKSEFVWEIMERMQGEIAGEIRVLLGESQYDQRIFDDEQRKRRIKAMRACAVEATSDHDRHEAWMQMHLDDGWRYGEEFNPKAKTHPNLLPWDQLPASTRSKARIFEIVSKTAAKLADFCKEQADGPADAHRDH